jgi:P-type E1-E2 ATPase
VGDRDVAVGSPSWLARHGFDGAETGARALDAGDSSGLAKIAVGVSGRLAGIIVMGDRIRPDAAELIAELRDVGIRHIAMVTGDRTAIAEDIGRDLALDRVYAEQSPEEKLDVVRAVRGQPDLAPVLMVGDGVNDAPALAMADVGIAMGARGATASSETADAVISIDRIQRVAEAVRIGQRSLHIATQSVVFGMALSGIAMVLAAAGFIPPVGGALLQEAIDVAVILNALRALRE